MLSSISSSFFFNEKSAESLVKRKCRRIDELWLLFILAAVDPNEVQVRNLTAVEFIFSPEEGTFILNVSWQKPSFNYSEILAYDYSYQVDLGNETMTGTVSVPR